MSNSLPNRITKAAAETAANATYAKYDALSDVYDQITASSTAGDFSRVVTVPPSYLEFIVAELVHDGYDAVSSDGTNEITITWGVAPPH